MRRFTTLVAILLLLTAVAPALACVTDAAMTASQNACCQEMHGQCGEMAKTGCCRTEIQRDDAPQIASATVTAEAHWICIAQLHPLYAPIGSLTQAASELPIQHPPPNLLTAETTVLRI